MKTRTPEKPKLKIEVVDAGPKSGNVVRAEMMVDGHHFADLLDPDIAEPRMPRKKWEQSIAVLAAAPELFDALDSMLACYVSLVNSGDAGFWNPETDKEVKAARKALAKALGK